MRRKKKSSNSNAKDNIQLKVLSDEDDDVDIPLKVLKRSISCEVDPNSYDSLCMPSEEPCELCDRVSRNKYHSLIHNVRHIIIPLLNQKVCQCEICLHHFTSQDDLKRHIARKHTLAELVGQTDLVRKRFNNPEDGSYNSDLISIVKKEINDTEYIVKKEQPCLKEILTDTKQNIVKLKDSDDSSETYSLKNRLFFEEDIISLHSDRLLTDLTTDCQVNVELFPPFWEAEPPKSVGYDELVKPGMFRCKKCGKTFPSRYEAIIHEAHHIFINTNISNNVTNCKLCHIYIVGDYANVMQHKRTSHMTEEDITRKRFGAETKQNGATNAYDTYKKTWLRLCALCFSFCKSTGNINYNYITELSEEGKRYVCNKCGTKFFNIYLVKRVVKKFNTQFGNKPKKVTNEDRLKMFQKRLKLMR